MKIFKICTLVTVVLQMLSSVTWAVRPFVTDDARIVSKGQIEIESWPEINLVGDEQTYALQFMGGYSPTEWFEIIVGSGGGYDYFDKQSTFANPVISPKFLFYKTVLNSFIPGIALDMGQTINTGRGSLYDDGIAQYAIAMATWRFYDDWLNIHLNIGRRYSRLNEGNFSRKYWGIGFDIGVIKPEYRLIIESYAGDPMEAIAPKVSYQFGGRWLKSDYVNFDLTMGTQREPLDFHSTGNKREYWVQFGIRLLFDTPFVSNPSHEGAEGLIPRT